MTTSAIQHPATLDIRRCWSSEPPMSDDLWPVQRWTNLVQAGVTKWVIPRVFGGDPIPPEALVEGCIELARGDLLVTFILSQFQAACQRLVASERRAVAERWLPLLARGECFTTVGISHLTTSRQHTVPAVTAEPHGDGFRLTGEVPWVTGAPRADVIVLGGTLANDDQILAAVPRERDGVTCAAPLPLLALSGSETGPIQLNSVTVGPDDLIAGPVRNVVQKLGSGGAGSLTTSALAVGHAWACIDHLEREAASRPALKTTHAVLLRRAEDLRTHLRLTAGSPKESTHSTEQLRTRATDLALKASQALLTASKGAGFAKGHPAERLAREALFFLVWSCPQAVAGKLMEGFGQCEVGSFD